MSSDDADIILKVTGMMCQKNCASTVQKAISATVNVSRCEVSYLEGKASVWGNTSKINDIITAVEDVGYEAALIYSKHEVMHCDTYLEKESEQPADLILAIKGMFDVNSCPRKIEELLLTVDGVFKVSVNFSSKTSSIWGFADYESILETLANAGYSARDVANTKTGECNLNIASGKSFPWESGADLNVILVDLVKVQNINVQDFNSIKHSMQNIAGVVSVVVDVERGYFVLSMTLSDKTQVMNSLASLGYSSAVIKESADVSSSSLNQDVHENSNKRREWLFDVTGMSCANCAMKIEKTLLVMPGVVEAGVSAMTNKARVVIVSDGNNIKIAKDAIGTVCGPRDIVKQVESMGYGCELVVINNNSSSSSSNNKDCENNSTSSCQKEINEWFQLLIISLLLGVPVMSLHIAMGTSDAVMMAFDMPLACHGAVNISQGVMLALNLPILLIVGYRYYKGALLGALHGNFGMDCLVTAGTSITFLYSCVQVSLACSSGDGVPSQHVFFETTGMLLMFVTVGKFIEAYAKGRSFSAISNLLKLQPREANLVIESGIDFAAAVESIDATICNIAAASLSVKKSDCEVTKLISIDLIQKGDILKVFPGDRMPTDGYVLYGSTYLDESMITGESLPVHKISGSLVFGATLNQTNCVYIQVTSLGADSALAQIVKLVETAQLNKAPVQAYADRLAGIFTPIMLLFAAMTFIVWYTLSLTHVIPISWFQSEYRHHDVYLFAMQFAISVVVISCPCALGLATPTAIMVGTSVGASNGILIKGGSAFETAHTITTVLFDKTGTLTSGRPTVTDIIVLHDVRKGVISSATYGSNSSKCESILSQDALLRLAATVEQGSNHPIARAILETAKVRGVVLHNNNTPSLNINGEVESSGNISSSISTSSCYMGNGMKLETSNGVVILVGNRSLMEENGISVSPTIDAAMWDMEVQGKTAICVALGSVICGILGIADTAQAEAYSTIKALQQMGLDVWMITGDNRTTAEALADELDLSKDRVLAGILPKDKAVKVQELQALGQRVAMVGDGINDSPALAQADLGIAIGAGTEVAIDAADMVLIRNNLHDLVVSLDLAKCVFTRIQVNFLWAMIYNIIAVPYAAGLWYPWTKLQLPPQYAGLSMAASSVSVVLSSMALWYYKRPSCLSNDQAVVNLLSRDNDSKFTVLSDNSVSESFISKAKRSYYVQRLHLITILFNYQNKYCEIYRHLATIRNNLLLGSSSYVNNNSASNNNRNCANVMITTSSTSNNKNKSVVASSSSYIQLPRTEREAATILNNSKYSVHRNNNDNDYDSDNDYGIALSGLISADKVGRI